MKITNLRLLGFKSFAESTDIPVEPGLTGIVGPNGCGKSNLVEALRFVMGESSYKAMRGSGMEDVIFSGTGRRPSRNSAEVTLVAERSGEAMAGFVPADAAILEITRRIERDAGSVFKVNGKDVRARDVQLMFADAATGARSSALVRQGRIGEIISAKPVQRRAILEDAAGISGLHSRRHEAELKLKGTEQNLERLDDVMSEIAGQLEALKRQARQAVRYRNISGDIRRAEATQFMIRWNEAVQRIAACEAALSGLTRQLAEATAAQATAAKDEALLAASLPDLREQAAAAGAALQRIRLLGEELDRERERLQARREEVGHRIEQASQDLDRENEILEECKVALVRNNEEKSELELAEGQMEDRLAEAAQAAGGAADDVEDLESRLAEMSGLLASGRAEKTALDRTLVQTKSRADKLNSDRERLASEQVELASEIEILDRIEADRRTADETEAVLSAVESARISAEEALATIRGVEKESAQPLEEAQSRCAALMAEARTLQKLLDIGGGDDCPPIMDEITVEPGWEAALAVGLGDDLTASLDPRSPRHWSVSRPAENDPPLPSGLSSLNTVINAPGALARRLRQIGIVDDAEGEAVAKRLVPGQRLVSRSGAMWRWDGFAVAPGTATSAAHRMEQQNRLLEISDELAEADRDLEETRADREVAAKACATAESELEGAKEHEKAARQASEEARRVLSAGESQAARASERKSSIKTAIGRLDEDLLETRRARLETEKTIAELAELGPVEAKRGNLAERLSTARSAAADLRAKSESMVLQETNRKRRLAELAQEQERWVERQQRAAERTGELKARRDALVVEAEKMDEAPDRIEDRRRELLTQAVTAESAAASEADALAEAENGYNLAAATARRTLEDLSAARETNAREEERANAASEVRNELMAQITEHFGQGPESLREIANVKPEAPLPEADYVERRLERLRAERERLGGVNLRAEEEASEIAERLDGLTADRDDLEAAIRQLRQGIQNLNREGRERLVGAFDIVNDHFKTLFERLFGGGSAHLELVDSDDPLEAGLEIFARPPGKKIQIMTLLSGGEQALTALALIFAVFLTNPSPICVLDEVDAPLDDANIERFCELLDTMREKTETRFVIVTHNPITMARMDRLFGITMAERGISQVVSVDLQDAAQYREAV